MYTDTALAREMVASKTKMCQIDTISKWNWDRSCQKKRPYKNSRLKCTRMRKEKFRGIVAVLKWTSTMCITLLWLPERLHKTCVFTAFQRTCAPSLLLLSSLITGKIAHVQPHRRQCQQIFFGRWAPGLKSLEPVDFTFVGKVPRVLDPLKKFPQL